MVDKINYRQQTIEVPPKVVHKVDFEADINHILFNNFSGGDLYTAFDIFPRPTTYEVAVKGGGNGILARPMTTRSVYVYNDSLSAIRVMVTCFKAEFNPATLASYGSSTPATGGAVSDQVAIKAFNTPLPVGLNHIGKVTIAEMPAQSLTLATLPSGVNNIGKVDVANFPPLPAGENKIGTVGILGGVTIDAMPPVQLSGAVNISDTKFSTAGALQYFSKSITTNAGTNTVVPLGMAVENFKHISNDGSVNVKVAFSEVGLTTEGANGYILLKAGEVLSELNIKATEIYMLSATATVVRVVGVV